MEKNAARPLHYAPLSFLKSRLSIIFHKHFFVKMLIVFIAKVGKSFFIIVGLEKDIWVILHFFSKSYGYRSVLHFEFFILTEVYFSSQII